MMETPITVNELNKIDSVSNQAEYNNRLEKQALDQCISEINNILKRYWHNISSKSYIVPERFEHGYTVFDKAKAMFEKEGINLSYYQPHGMLIVARIDNQIESVE